MFARSWISHWIHSQPVASHCNGIHQGETGAVVGSLLKEVIEEVEAVGEGGSGSSRPASSRYRGSATTRATPYPASERSTRSRPAIGATAASSSTVVLTGAPQAVSASTASGGRRSVHPSRAGGGMEASRPQLGSPSPRHHPSTSTSSSNPPMNSPCSQRGVRSRLLLRNGPRVWTASLPITATAARTKARAASQVEGGGGRVMGPRQGRVISAQPVILILGR